MRTAFRNARRIVELAPIAARGGAATAPGLAVAFVCVAIAGGYYAFLLTAGSSGLFAPLPHGLVFNDMLLHLLQGRFDVDPAAIGDEGYLRDGATYAYFGIFPALFRALFLWLPDFATTDLTRVGCLAAVCLMALFKVLAAFLVWSKAGQPRAGAIMVPLLVAAILAGGPQIQFLRPSMFQEVGLWAGACAAVFLYLFLRGWLRQDGFSPRLLNGMALAAGLCLVTRVSTALGLYLALCFLWLHLGWCELHRPRASLSWRRAAAFAMPMLILAGFAAATGLVNYQRWGNPLVFADLSRALIVQRFPERLLRLAEYGEFNPLRLGYGLIYYFLPLWVLRGADGQLWWSAFQQRAIDAVELPPSSFLVSDPLLLGLAIYGAMLFFRRGQVLRRGAVAAVAAGFAVPILLMLTAISMCFRYRLEFYPLIELAAFAGFAGLAASRPTGRTQLLCGIAAVAGIVIAHGFWILYMISPFGPAPLVMGPLGILDFYRSLLH